MSREQLFVRIFVIAKLIIITILLIIISLENKENLTIFENFLRKTIQVIFTVLSDTFNEAFLQDNHNILLRL